MSKSRSPSHNSHLSPSETAKYPVPQISKPQSPGSGDQPAKVSSPSRDEPKLRGPSTSPVTEHQSPKPSTRRRISVEEYHSEESMAKRIRRASPSPERRSKNQSSPDSDSQGDMADNEMELQTAGKAEQASPAPPPKKKRTRTLTTPHQSAVLHALLAKSRFPTTAVREEVGRSIGLSARKVQIWFQNQRQKARRPRNQGDTTRPTLYGPFQSMPESSSTTQRFHGYGAQYSGRTQLESSSSTSEPPPRLLGPGMPGPSVGYPMQGFRPVLPAPSPNLPVSESPFSRSYAFPPTSSPHPYRSVLPSVRPPASSHVGWHERERDPSRTLPPLLPSRPPNSNPLPSMWVHPVNMSQPTAGHSPHRSLSPEQRFVHHPSGPGRRPSLSIPPPFTLQPAPQWDESVYLPRPSSSWPRQLGSRSTRIGSLSPRASRRGPIRSFGRESSSDPYHVSERSPLLQPSVPSRPSVSRVTPPRSGRYDPIRATFIPYSRSPRATIPPQDRLAEERVQSDKDDRPTSPSNIGVSSEFQS